MKSTRASHSKSMPPAILLRAYAPEAVQWDMQQIQLAIARRAYELFETRNREHGHDWEDWFQGESELLRPVTVVISETGDRFSVRANVLGFGVDELKVSVEPRRMVILGRKEISTAGEVKEAGPNDLYPDQIMRLIEIASEVDPASAVIELQSGILKCELLKVAKPGAKAAGAA
jgi:HSP20 family molecular chaperone IbpA